VITKKESPHERKPRQRVATDGSSSLTARRVVTYISDNLGWFLAIGVFVVGSFTLDSFLNPVNLRNILLHSTVIATLAVGTSICLITGFFDMAQEAILILTACVAAWLCAESELASGWMIAPWIAVIAALTLGTGIGLLQGICVTKLGMVPFITSLSLRMAILGSVLVLMQGGSLAPLPQSYRYFGAGYVGPIPVPVIFVIVLYVTAHWMLSRTPLGRSFYAVGGNRLSARNAGINDSRMVTLAFMASGLTGALAGWIQAGRLNATNYSMVSNITFEVIAGAVIGGISMAGGRGNLAKSVSGILMMTLIVNYLSLRHMSAWYMDLTRGIVLLLATFLDSRMRALVRAGVSATLRRRGPEPS